MRAVHHAELGPTRRLGPGTELCKPRPNAIPASSAAPVQSSGDGRDHRVTCERSTQTGASLSLIASRTAARRLFGLALPFHAMSKAVP
jgi:hypothetical protein